MAQRKQIQLVSYEDECSIPGFAQWVRDPEFLLLWCRPAAISLIRPLVWEPPCAVGSALKKKQQQQKKSKRKVLKQFMFKWIIFHFK